MRSLILLRAKRMQYEKNAVSNIVVAQANRQMLLLVYAAVVIFCFITFRSWRAVLCAILPLI